MHLSGESYFSHLRKKLTAAIAALSRLRNRVDSKTLIILYHAFFGSILNYGIESFGLNYSKLTTPVYILQKRAIRIVTKSGFCDHTEPLFISCDILPYVKLVHYSICVSIYKSFLGRCPQIVHFKTSVSSTRNAEARLILIDKFRKKCCEFSVRIGGAIIWNSLPSCIRGLNCSVNVFKHKLKEFLLCTL